MKKWLVELELIEATIVMMKFVEVSAASAGAAIAEAKASNPTYIAKSAVDLSAIVRKTGLRAEQVDEIKTRVKA